MSFKPLQTILNLLNGVKPLSDGSYRAICPAHDDHNPSLSIGIGKDERVLLHCFAGCVLEKILRVMGITEKDLFSQPSHNGASKRVNTLKDKKPSYKTNKSTETTKTLVCAYEYTDEAGAPLFQVRRYSDKSFSQHKSDGKGNWMDKLYDARRVLYQLPQLADVPADSLIYICEGEEDAKRLISEGLYATSCSGGAGKWKFTDDTPLQNHHVIILEDNDTSGRKHALDVAARLHKKAKSVRILSLPGLPERGDVSDWLDADHDVEDLDTLVGETPIWEPSLGDMDEEDPQASNFKPKSTLQRVDNTATRATMPKGIVDKQQPKLWRPFPVHLLPTPLRNFIVEGAKSCGVDPSMYVLPVLTTCAAAIGNTRILAVKNNWPVPSILWGVTIARSGSVKSPPFTDATKPLALRDAGKLRDHEDILLSYERECAIYEEKYKIWKKNAISSGEDPPTKPIEPEPDRLLVNDTTVEALVLLLSKHPRGLLLARDELNGWLKSFGAYKQGRGGDEACWIAMYNGKRLVVDRKTNQRLIVCECASTSICGTIQPDILRSSLREDQFHSGLAARLLMIMPPRQKRCWNDFELSSDTELIYDHTIGKLLTLQFDTTDAGKEKPRTIKFSTEAKELYKEFFDDHGARQDQTEDGRLAAAFSKLEETACRLALIIHMVRWADDDPYITDENCIGVEDIKTAIEMANWFIHETERVYYLFSEDEGAIIAHELFDWVVKQGGTVTARHLQRSSRKYETAEDAELALDDLVERKLGEWKHPKPGPNGGAPSKLFIAATDIPVDKTTKVRAKDEGSVNAPTEENENQ